MTDQPVSVSASKVFTIAPGANFLDTLTTAIVDGRFRGVAGRTPRGLELTDYTILLPTRRAARAMQDAFLRLETAGAAMLLPRMRPIAEGEEDATLIAGLVSRNQFDGDIDLPPAVSELERRLVLMQLVQRWSESTRDGGDAGGDVRAPYVGTIARSPAQSAHLAGELARLMDLIETEGVDLNRLTELVPDTHSEHWQQTLDFLDVIVSAWPAYLSAAGRLSPADRRNRLIRSEAARLMTNPPPGPVIVAGVTGSIPATSELMQVVAALDNGVIVLPGLDRTLERATCSAIVAEHPEHPQSGLIRLVNALGLANDQVEELNSVRLAKYAPGRNQVVGEVMRPASSSDQWYTLPDRIDPVTARAALQRVHRLTAANSQDEAEAVALILREAAEHPGRTAALVSPDRLLARRVAIRLETWGIRVDDSAGRPFAKTVAGAFLDLVIEAMATDFAPKPLMALLKHPLTRLGHTAFDIRRAARALELAAFRTDYLGSGLDGIEAGLERASQDASSGRRRERALVRLWPEDWDGARQLITDLRAAFAPLSELFEASRKISLPAITEAHIAVSEVLSALPDEQTKGEQLWRDEAGEAGAQLFSGLLDPELLAPELMAADYPEFYRTLAREVAVRPQIPTHPRIFIWGPFESRLLQPDVVVLGSLNEATWPEAADPGPWLNRSMRRDLGLPAPEEQIGYAAHDFSQLLGAETVYLTRSEMIEGDPSVPSRWLLRLDAVLARLGLSDCLEAEQPWLAWAQDRDRIDVPHRIGRPEPRPPLELRPRRLSVSSIETWIANPYALFAERILKLDALAPLGGEPAARLRGSVVHEALGQFAQKFPVELPHDPTGAMLAIAHGVFTALRAHPRVAAFWLPRFERFASWFGQMEPELRKDVERTIAEVAGSTVIEAPGGPFTLTARADRIDVGGDRITITDYKTGANLSNLAARARTGRAPQLLLEGLIAREAGFAGVEPCSVSGLRYISASGGEPPGAVVDIAFDDVRARIEETAQELRALVALFDDEATPYPATRRPQFQYDYDSYAHLARISEWAGETAEEAE